MVATSDIINLVKSYSFGKEAFVKQCRGIAAAQREGIKKEILYAVDTLENTLKSNPSIDTMMNSHSSAIHPVPVTHGLEDMVLSASVEADLALVAEEHRNREKLLAQGFSPVHRLLFLGPPGVGKTMAAMALAKKLNLPFYLLQWDAAIGSFLGESTARLRKCLATVKEQPGIYLMDEVDGICGVRKREDVSEMRRVLNVLLKLLEEDSQGVLIAATNLPEHLDPALFRRFDKVIRFLPPTHVDADRLLWKLVSKSLHPAERFTVGKYLPEGCSHADICSVASAMCKKALLHGKQTFEVAAFLKELEKYLNTRV